MVCILSAHVMSVLLAVLSSQSIPMSPILSLSYSPLLKKLFLHQQHVHMLPPTRLSMQSSNVNIKMKNRNIKPDIITYKHLHLLRI